MALATDQEAIAFCAEVGVTINATQAQAAIALASSALVDACRCQFEPTVLTETVTTVNGRALLSWPLVASVDEVDGSPATVTFTRAGEITLPDGTHTVKYTHGHAAVPARIKRACLLLVRHLVKVDPTDWDNRSTFKSNELASWSLVTPGVKGAITPIPEVNQVIADYGFPQDIV